ncbi:glycerophosphodiester phosphodiesterase [Maribellus luteus]|uniref:Glycerophosphodiester phosphodiesterase n=1 Tax=Maribellus luteus TaxID=2305463 RepID=A0A399T502_9BACT|nr:glycerophosphodiester phosphodiesterase family protein [Maribellus luteus]RIJ50004.1 glycerophosphodiester phosphodiesterase [Maribellus luteus]
MKTIISIVLFVVLGYNLMAQSTFIAHRGASYLAPENTLAAVNLAWELGADAVEIDIHLAKDNRVMVIHDKDTKRTCNGKKNLEIKSTPSILLRDQDAGIWKGEEFKGEKIPYLSEVIQTIPSGKTLVVEIKCGAEVIPALERILEESGKQDQIVFISFDWDAIVKAQKVFPDNKCYWLSSSKKGLSNKMEEAAANKLAGVNLQYSIIDKDVMAVAKKLNLDVLTWTVNDPAEAKRLADLGVKGITTNRPKWLKEEMSNL